MNPPDIPISSGSPLGTPPEPTPTQPLQTTVTVPTPILPQQLEESPVGSAKPYPKNLKILHISLLVALPVTYFLDSAVVRLVNVYPNGRSVLAFFGWTIIFLASIGLIALFIHQLLIIKNTLNKKTLYRQLIYLAAIGGLLPMVATILGDVFGTLQFNTPENNFPIYAYFFIGLTGVSILSALLGIATLIRVSIRITPRALRIIGYILYGLLWLATAVISFFIYSLIYALHDPSTE